MAKTVESEFYRRRRNVVVEQVRDAFPGIFISAARARRCTRTEWEFRYGNFLWYGPAAGTNDAVAKGWLAYIYSHGEHARQDVNVPAQFAFVA